MSEIPYTHAILTTLIDAAGTAPTDPVEASRYLQTTMTRAVETAERAIADGLPPVKVADLASAQDHDTQREAQAYFDRMYETVNVSELDGYDDVETWEVVKGSSRYEVRTVPAGTDDEGDSYPDRFMVWDTENHEQPQPYAINDAGEDPDYDREDEDEARRVAEAMNRQDYQENAAGWPFAHNYAVAIEDRDVEDFDAAGFVVVTYKGDTTYAGIDGGGYSFLDSHYLPLYLRRAARNGWYVRTKDGLRRVTE